MYIQYVGFNVAAGSRIYTFRVMDNPRADRTFTVRVEPEAFIAARLKLQDGPAICFARLKQELKDETQESRAGNNLSIEDHDIREYWERHHPRPPLEHKTETRRWVEENERYQQGSPPSQSNVPVAVKQRVP
jgi:hypothetical protein